MANEKVGAMWEKHKADGETFFFIEIERDGVKEKYKAWKNKYKTPEDKKPDYQLVIDTWKPPERNAQVAEPVRQIVNSFNSRPAAFDDDSIPF